MLLQECASATALFFVHHILFFNSILGFLEIWRLRLSFGCDVRALVQGLLGLKVWQVSTLQCIHVCVCVAMNVTDQFCCALWSWVRAAQVNVPPSQSFKKRARDPAHSRVAPSSVIIRYTQRREEP